MNKDLHILGAVAKLKFIGVNDHVVLARVDTGAKISAVWASNIKVVDGELKYRLFGKTSRYYDGKVITTSDFRITKIRSTNGGIEERYVVKLPITINGRKIKASFTLANRKLQVYPVLVGRNILRGKFAVDIKHETRTEGDIKK